MPPRDRRVVPLRQRILLFVTALILFSLFGSVLSVYRIGQVSRLLDSINRISVPLSRLMTQMQADAEVFQREMDRGLGYSHWRDPHWRPRAIPHWIEEVLSNEVDRAKDLIHLSAERDSQDAQRWMDWANGVEQGLAHLKEDAARLYSALDQHDEAKASEIYPRWNTELQDWIRQIQWGATEHERALRQAFSLAESRSSELRTGLELILVVVIGLSLLLLWLGERALRPLGELTRLAREIARRGLRKEDKSLLITEVPLSRNDEVSQLAREFHRMATALLERERVVEAQNRRLEDQNQLLREMGELNFNVLNSIESILIVTDLERRITQCNPGAARWLGVESERIIGSSLTDWPKLREILADSPIDARISPKRIEGRTYGGRIMPLRQDAREGSEVAASGRARGAILVLEDLTEDLDLQDRLRIAENLAAVGRMSAQVAHEVRNPLHSLGLEAEMAAERVAKLGDVQLKQSLQSILGAVDRLEKITDNYLKLSRLSAGQRVTVDVGEVLEAVLATYAPVCEAQGVRIDWRREKRSDLRVTGDRDLLEQVLGNLLRNALQALEGADSGAPVAAPAIVWSMGNTESGRVWIRIEDNGPGLAAEVKARIFTPFVTTRAQGTGLGLSFIKKVLEDHGGSIQYLDQPLQAGACFEIVLPPADTRLGAEREEVAWNELETHTPSG